MLPEGNNKQMVALVESLQEVLAAEGKILTLAEANEVGETLISYFEILATSVDDEL